MPSAAVVDRLSTIPYAALVFISDLEHGAAITGCQAKLLLDGWHELEDEWWASPYLRTVREHSRAYVDQLRHQTMSTPIAPEVA